MGTVASGGGSGAAWMVRACALLLVVSAIVFAANTGYGNYLAMRENNARAMAAELQVLSQQLAKFAQLAVHGSEDDFDAFTAVRTRIDRILLALRKGSNSPSLQAYEGNVLEVGTSSALMRVTRTWSTMSVDADRIQTSRDKVLDATETASRFNVRVPQLSAQLAEVVRGMSDAGSAASQINLANRQIVLADRMSRRTVEILAGGDAAITAADALQRDAAVFGQVLQALRDGNPEAGVVRVTDPSAVAALDKVAGLYADAQKDLDSLLKVSTDLVEVQQSAAAIAADSDDLLEGARGLHDAIGAGFRRLFPNDLISLLAGLVAAVALVGLLAGVQAVLRSARFP